MTSEVAGFHVSLLGTWDRDVLTEGGVSAEELCTPHVALLRAVNTPEFVSWFNEQGNKAQMSTHVVEIGITKYSRQAVVMPSKPGIVKKAGYLVHGSTSCSCCQSENFLEGIFDDPKDAKFTVDHHMQHKTCASQYSETGVYTVFKCEYEELQDGRVIIGDRIFDSTDIDLESRDANHLVNGMKAVDLTKEIEKFHATKAPQGDKHD